MVCVRRGRGACMHHVLMCVVGLYALCVGDLYALCVGLVCIMCVGDLYA